MLNRLIQWSLAHRAIVLAFSVVLLVVGLQSGLRLPVEVLPDLTKPTVIILTEAPGLAPEEVETRVTQPIESVLLGVSGLTRLRSNSDVSLSLVYAEFGWDTDIYKARTLVQERLQSAREQLPAGVQPFMTPMASLMGEILLVDGDQPQQVFDDLLTAAPAYGHGVAEGGVGLPGQRSPHSTELLIAACQQPAAASHSIRSW